jgi:hypothetical protein
MKKIFLIGLLSIILSACGGGGGGGVSTPPNSNPGITTVLRLLDVQNVAQTNSTVFLKAKLSDGTGKPVINETVYFTKISGVGDLSASSAPTDTAGVATIAVYSAAPGASTVLASVGSGAGQVRDRRTIFFTADGTPPAATMLLDVNSSPGNTVYNEASDFILFENSGDDTVEILATVYDREGFRIGGGWGVWWYADHSEAEFIITDNWTNANGQAQAIIKVVPESLRATDTHLSIYALAENGAFNMVTLFLRPVIVDSITVSADPTRIDSGGKSTISAVVKTSTGALVADGTVVNFTATGGGGIAPLATTKDGVAQATLNAPTLAAGSPHATIQVTASVGGKSGSTSVTVTAPALELPPPAPPVALAITPAAITVTDGAAPQTVSFILSGGTAPYTVTSSHPNIAFNDNGAGGGTANNGVKDGGEVGTWTNVANGGTVQVTIPANAVTANTVVTISAVSTGGGTAAAATLTINE